MGFLLIGLATLSGCAGTNGKTSGAGPASLVSLQVSAGSTSVTVGQTEQLTATGTYSDQSTRDLTSSVHWSATPASAVSISASGLLTAKASGTVSVTAKLNGVSGGLSVNIAAQLVSIQVTAANPNIAVSQTEQLTATGTYSDKSVQDLTSSVTWTTSPAGLATVSAAGVLAAQNTGTISITATQNSVSGSLSLTIAPELLSIAITPPTATIAAHTKQQFTATGTYSDGSSQNITSIVSWNSSNTSYATISDASPTKGLALGVAGPGTTKITATAGTVSGTASLSVTNATATGLTITPKPSTIPLFVSRQFTATASFNDGTSQDVSNAATWTSSASVDASVTATGLVTAKVANTSVTITATFETQSDDDTFTINTKSVDSVTISPPGPIAQGTKIQFTATGTFDDGSTHDLTSQVTWSSSVPSTLKFNSSGVSSTAQALQQGSVTITAALSSSSGTITGTLPSFTVSDATIQSIAVTPANKTIQPAGHADFAATGYFVDSSGNSLTQDITNSVRWSSSDPSVASIQTSGSNAGIAIGGTNPGTNTTTISASFSAAGASASGQTSLTVTDWPLTGLAVSPNSGVGLIAPGASLQYTAIATWTNQSDPSESNSQAVNQFSNWQSSDKSIATVNGAGLVSGVSPGTATLTATYGSLSATTSVQVESSPLCAIQILPPNVTPSSSCSQMTPITATVPQSIQTSLTAWGIFNNGDALNLTTAVGWNSSSSSIATISNVSASAGVATGVTVGSVTISAVYPNPGSASSGPTQIGTATLTVTNANLVSIEVSPSNPNPIALGNSLQFTAVGRFTQQGLPDITLDITNQVTWMSTTPSVAVIKPNGIAVSASKGSTGITASLNGMTSSPPTNLIVD